LNWLKQWFNPSPAAADGQVLALQRELQHLRLELQEREQVVIRLQQELERQRSGSSARFSEAVQVQLEQLLADAASPVTQLATQAHLLEIEVKPVQGSDVLAVAMRLVRLLEDYGLALVGQAGQVVSFDPNQHEPLQSGLILSAGQPVVIRFAGVSYQGKLLRKAGVMSDAGSSGD
jgi:molecular chaperone GrpE (heat shock protein)